ncbi:MAG TPA: hypothetical protein VIF62_38260 [Labilithrix sp.]|jgi:hypothetical protein
MRFGLFLAALALAGCSKSSTPNCGGATDQPPDDLACTGLYSDFDSKTIAPNAREYAPAVPLWSDGAEKTRWIALPDGQNIDATNPDEWKFPVGTKVWKEFRSPSSQKIETRLLWKTQPDHWVLAAYVWSGDGSSAHRGEGASPIVDGQPYHVPSEDECVGCHKGRTDVLLGFETISLAQPAATGFTLAVLAQENRITPPPAKTAITIDPGLGELHVNCGVSCHNATSAATRHDSNLRLRISTAEAESMTVDKWELYATTVNVPATLPLWSGKPIVIPGDPNDSIIVSAMTSTDATGKMPPIASSIDVSGTMAVEAWIKTLK